MIDYRCKNCTWWDNQHPSVRYIPDVPELAKAHPGFCRKHKPVGLSLKSCLFGAQPVMDAEEFCGEYRAGVGG